MLRALDVDCSALRDELKQNTPDIDIFTYLADSKRVFITADKSQVRRQHEAVALRKAKVTAIFIEPFWSKLAFWNQAVWLLKNWPTIESFSESTEVGSCGMIKQRGKIQPFSP